MSQNKVTLLLPGYTLNSLSHDEAVQDIESVTNGTVSKQRPSSAGFCTSFSFAHDLDRQPWQAQLAAILGLDTDGGKRLPSALLGISRTGHSAYTQEAPLVRADPISLKADRDSATLIPPEQLALTEQEADQLLITLNEFVADDGIVFFRHEAAQWYMSGLDADALASYPPSFLASRNASTFLPDGDAAATWRRLMTELQMLLHTHPVNQQRLSRALMPVNSIWFWGGAPLPHGAHVNQQVSIYADHDQACALAQYLNVSIKPLSQVPLEVTESFGVEHTVIVDTALFDAWLNADVTQLEKNLQRINEQWLEPLAQQVATGQLAQVSLLTEDGLQGWCNPQTLLAMSKSQSTGWLNRLMALFRR